ncbi:MAG: nitrate reductase molybdenum cofactor assembly chaperone [Alphaproteobacteria bacterium]
MRSFAALSRLLSYPEPELLTSLPALLATLAEERALPAAMHMDLTRLANELSGGDLLDAQERYVLSFDRTRSLSLHLYEHLHGESRDRGMAMVRLVEHYRRHGLEISARELPDHLPLVLEFLSVIPSEEARAILGDAADLIERLHAGLTRRANPYAAITAAILHLAGRVPAAAEGEAAAPVPDPEREAAEMDREWEDAPVTFGPGAAELEESCPRASEALRRMSAQSAGRV